MKKLSYSTFETAIGVCGIAWSESHRSGATCAVALFQLPEASEALTISRIARKSEANAASVPPPEISALIARVRKHLSGDTQDFQDVPIDWDGLEAFSRRVYEFIRRIPAGNTMTYGEIARDLGLPGSARAVGQAMGSNPVPLLIPCHRVLAAGGKSGGFSAHGGRSTKLKMLAIERAVPMQLEF